MVQHFPTISPSRAMQRGGPSSVPRMRKWP
jgi:hypothetical protein